MEKIVSIKSSVIIRSIFKKAVIILILRFFINSYVGPFLELNAVSVQNFPKADIISIE